MCPVLQAPAARHGCPTTRLLGESVGRVTCGFLDFALSKSPLYMGMGTLCTLKTPPIYVHVDTLHCQKAAPAGPRPYMWYSIWSETSLECFPNNKKGESFDPL